MSTSAAEVISESILKELTNMADKRHSEPHPGHSNHLCALIAGGSGYTEVKPLVKDPGYICAKCGRVAHCKNHLCEPEKIKT